MESNRRHAENETDAIKSASALSTTFVDSGSATYHSEPQCTTLSHDIAVELPTSLDSWKKVISLTDGFGWQWEVLRPIFLAKGCNLYINRISCGFNPRTASPPAINTFGLFGDRENFDSKPPLFSTVQHSMFVYIEEISR